MKNLNGKEILRGDKVLTAAPDGTVMIGEVHQFYDRNEAVRISNYPFQVPAKDTVLAQDAFDAFAVPLLKARAAAAASKAKDTPKAPEPPPTPTDSSHTT